MTQKETIKKVLHYIRRYRFFLIASLVLALITVVLTLYVPILTGQAVDLIVGKGQVDFAGVYRICVKIGIAILLTMVAQWVMNVANNKITYSVVRDIRTDAFEKIQVLPLSYIDSHSYGGIVSRVIADADQFADGLLMGFTQLFTGVITILGTLGFMLSVSVPIALVVVVLTPVSLFVAAFIAKRTYQMFRMQSETRGEQTALIEEMIGNQKVVQAFGQEKEVGDRFDEINDRLSKYSLQGTFFSSITNPSTRFVNALVYAAVGVFGAFFAIQGGISVGQLSCFLSYANQYTKPFNEISGVVTELQNALACAARVFELMEEPSELTEGTLLELRRIVEDYPYFQVARMLYLKNLAVLNDMSFTLELEKMAIFLPDRKKLFQLIEGDKYGLNSRVEHEPDMRKEDTFSLIDAFLSNRNEEPEPKKEASFLFQPSVSSDYMFWSLSKEEEEKPSGEDAENRLRHHDLIDSFIKNDQQRMPGSGLEIREETSRAETPESVKDLDDEQSKSLEDSCLTETLARIYIKQKRYDKALQIIKNLSLKYPEKNVYFADQIRFLEKLIINTKK